MRSKVRVAFLVLVLMILWNLGSALYTVGEMQQALVVRMGAPVDLITTPGLKLKLPLIDTVSYYDTRLLTLAPPSEQVILGDQKRLEVETYVRFRIAIHCGSTSHCVPSTRPTPS